MESTTEDNQVDEGGGNNFFKRRPSSFMFDKKLRENGAIPKILQSKSDIHHKKSLKRTTTIQAKSVKTTQDQGLSPLETIENIKAAIAKLDERVKEKGMMSKAMRRQRQNLLQQLQLAQMALIQTFDCKPCSRPKCIKSKENYFI